MKQSRRPLYIFIGGVIVIAVVIAIAVPLSLRDNDDDDDDDDKGNTVKKVSAAAATARIARTNEAIKRIDCYPEANGDKSLVKGDECTARGCVYDAMETLPCFHMESASPFKFELTSLNDTWIEGFLTNSIGSDVNKWLFTVEYINNDLMRFSMNSYKKDRYTVPVPLSLHKTKITDPKYQVHISEGEFAFEIVRQDTGAVIWSLETHWQGLILTDQLLQITTRLPSHNIYGLGENKHNSFRHRMNGTWPAWARDQFPSYSDEGNLYGVHPFYTCVEDDTGNTHGVLLMNSNAQEYAFSSRPSLTYRTIGGILDFYVFMGPSPEHVVQQYTGVIGRPMMPPYWGLGFQLSRYGYNNISNLKDAVDSTRDYDIPHDVQYVDIDHMEAQKDFTIDRTRFPGLNDYFKSLQAGGMRIIYLLDPCLIAKDNYKPYKMMKEADGAIKWPSDVTVPANVTDPTGALLGYVWPEAPVIFPDFFKESARNVWKNLIKYHRSTLTFDGLWIDMNEPASFGTNLDRPFNWPVDKKPYWTLDCPLNTLEDPPYRPKAAYRWDENGRRARLSDKTICLSAIQGEHGQYRQYDVHSLYGWSQTKPTLEVAREATGERSVVITRSTFPGSGQWAGHWLGDNASRWPDLHASIIGMLDFNLFGIPYIGADICGFNDDTTESLCLRWTQLGAFYPFCRNHNTIFKKKQGPGQLGSTVGQAAAEILRVRYRLLPYLYTLFHLAHTTGSTVVRPMHHEYPTDPVALSIDRQFLWGSSLLISPILEKNQTLLNYYLPKGRWYNYLTHDMTESSNGQWRSVSVNETSKPELFVRGGSIIVQQESANNTHYSRQNPLEILLALNEDGSAQGSFFWDDGVSIDTIKSGDYLTADFHVQDKGHQLDMTVTHEPQGTDDWQKLTVGRIQILGVEPPQGMNYEAGFRHRGRQSKMTLTDAPHYLQIDLVDPVPLANITGLTWG